MTAKFLDRALMRSYLHRSLFSSLNTALRSTSEFMFEQRLFIIPDMVRHTYKSDTLKRVHLKSRSCGSVWCLFYELEDRRNARLCKDLLRSYSISKWAAPVSNSSGRMTEGVYFVIKKVSTSGALTNSSFLVDVSRHDPNFALARLQVEKLKDEILYFTIIF